MDGLVVEHDAVGLGVQGLQHGLGGRDRGGRAGHPVHVAAVGNLHAQAQLDLAQVRVERAGQVGQAFAVGGVQGEIALRG